MIARRVLAALAILALSTWPAVPGGSDGAWKPLPRGTRAVLLATGADFGYVVPRGCNGRSGGAQYRVAFDRFLAVGEPAVERAWLAPGDVGPLGGATDGTRPLDDMYAVLRRVGYRAVGLGTAELADARPERLAGASPARPPIVATNVRRVGTRNAPFPRSVILTLGGARVLVLAVAPYLPDPKAPPPHAGALVSTPPDEAVRAELARRRGQADRVVLLSAVDQMTLFYLLRDVPGIDLVLASAGTLMRVGAEDVNGVPVLWLGSEGRLLGRVALGAKGEVLEISGTYVRDAFPVDPLTGQLAAR